MIEDSFKYLEPAATCPEHLKDELLSEIEIIRNSLQVIKLYAGDIFNVLTVIVTASGYH